MGIFSGCLKNQTAKLAAAAALSGACLSVSAADLHTWPQNQAADLPSLKQPVRVVNVWATWCAPCRREMPMLSRWYRAHGYGKKGSPVQVVGIALNREEELRSFTKTVKVSYPLWRYTGNDSRQFMAALGNSVGALPFTVVDAPKCGFRKTLLGEADAAKLDVLVKQALQQCAARKIPLH